jgi:hypothetical protein
MSECKIPNPNRDIRDDLGQKHECQKCKPIKLLLSITIIALLTSPKTIYVQTPATTHTVSLQSASQTSNSSIASQSFETIKPETVRTGGHN